MPTYELMVLLRTMPRTEVVSALKRAANAIFEKDGFIRKIENLGTRDLPFKMPIHGLVHKRATCVLFEFDTPPDAIGDLLEYYERDVDIVRKNIIKINDLTKVSGEQACTLQQELLPPPYRKEVIEMIEKGKKVSKKKFQYNSGLDYYPFQK